MCIDQITSNLFPYDTRGTSIIATSAIVTSVVTGALIAAAVVFKWGLPATGALAGVCGLSSLTAIAILACKEPAPYTAMPLPFEVMEKTRRTEKNPQTATKIPESKRNRNDSDSRYKAALIQMYCFVKHNDTANFTKYLYSLNRPQQKQFVTDCWTSSVLFIDEDDKRTTLKHSGQGYSLATIVTNLIDDKPWNVWFINELLKVSGSHEVEATDLNANFLKIENLEVSLVLSKLSAHSTKDLIEKLLQVRSASNQGPAVWHDHYREWMTRFLEERRNNAALRGVCSDDWLYRSIIQSELDPKIRVELLGEITMPLSPVRVDVSWGSSITGKFTGNLLHAAVAYDAPDLLIKLCEGYPHLMKQKTEGVCAVTPLMHAVLLKKPECVKALLKFIPDCNQTFPEKDVKGFHDFHPRPEATKITPLMFARQLGNQEIIEALVKAGADDQISDGAPNEHDMWDWYKPVKTVTVRVIG